MATKSEILGDLGYVEKSSPKRYDVRGRGCTNDQCATSDQYPLREQDSGETWCENCARHNYDEGYGRDPDSFGQNEMIHKPPKTPKNKSCPKKQKRDLCRGCNTIFECDPEYDEGLCGDCAYQDQYGGAPYPFSQG